MNIPLGIAYDLAMQHQRELIAITDRHHKLAAANQRHQQPTPADASIGPQGSPHRLARTRGRRARPNDPDRRAGVDTAAASARQHVQRDGESTRA